MQKTDTDVSENIDRKQGMKEDLVQNMKIGKPLKIGDLTAGIPVIQGGMGVGISLSSLAGNVALCGGVGVISSAQIGFRDPQWERELKSQKQNVISAWKSAVRRKFPIVSQMPW